MASTLLPGELLVLDALVTPTAQGIASRVLARTAAGKITLFAFDAGEELSEHTAPFDALVLTLSGALVLTIGGREVRTAPQSIVLIPAKIAHAVRASEPSRMLLIMLREHLTDSLNTPSRTDVSAE
jgi:quercetin dioxygenase-like cupin family protein